VNVATALGPASETSTSPFRSNATANGTSAARVTGNSPPDQITWLSLSRSPETWNTETLLLPAFTANSRPLARS